MQSSTPQSTGCSYIAGTGMNVPEKIIDNDFFATYLDTSDEWITSRTGIKQRRWADDDVSASSLAFPAAKRAIAAAGLLNSDIDGVIVATVTPDYIFPSTACRLQNLLGIHKGFAFDMNAVCSGFIYALVTADAMIKAGHASNILVVGTEIYSSIIDKSDRSTCVLFGDGAGAVVLSRANEDNPSRFLGGRLYADGQNEDILTVPQGTANRITSEKLQNSSTKLRMEGREVFKLAVRSISESCSSILQEMGVSTEEVDYLACHQANFRILQSVGKQLNIPAEKVLINLEKYGNTSAASVPILLDEFSRNGTIKKGDLVLLTAFGGGTTWGACLIRW
ncbi:MAG: ketoacyl-ACP synthase III [bacterium]|nr:ketoacyl-ACP synthase III [bacterium]